MLFPQDAPLYFASSSTGDHTGAPAGGRIKWLGGPAGHQLAAVGLYAADESLSGDHFLDGGDLAPPRVSFLRSGSLDGPMTLPGRCLPHRFGDYFHRTSQLAEAVSLSPGLSGASRTFLGPKMVNIQSTWRPRLRSGVSVGTHPSAFCCFLQSHPPTLFGVQIAS